MTLNRGAKILLMAVTLVFSSLLFAQSVSRDQTDLTLFGNPSCAQWPAFEDSRKEAWLRGILAPLNYSFLLSNKGEPDRLAKEGGLKAAAFAVDQYCTKEPLGQAMQGATDYLKELWVRRE